jgi:hypothetical protein
VTRPWMPIARTCFTRSICKPFGKCNILRPKVYEDLGFVRQSLGAFPEATISYVPNAKSISAPYLKLLSLVAPIGHLNPLIADELRSRLLYYLGASATAVSIGSNRAYDIDNESCTGAEARVYISRAKATERRIVNEKSVVNKIKSLGYHIAHMEDLSFSRQVTLMQGTKMLRLIPLSQVHQHLGLAGEF